MLYDKRTDMISAFVNKNIYSGDVERDAYYTPKGLESKPECEEGIAERTKMTRQKSDKKIKKNKY